MHWTEEGRIQVTKNFAIGTAAVIVGLALVMMLLIGMLISGDGDSDPRVQPDPTANEDRDTSIGTEPKTKYPTCTGIGCSTEEDAPPTGQAPITRNTATPPVTDDEILTMVPSNIGGLIFILNMKAIRESRDQLPEAYRTFAQDIEKRIERQLNNDEITANEVDTFVFTGQDNGLILVRGDFKYEDIRFKWQGEDYRKRTYRGYEIWDGADTYAILEDRRTVIGSNYEGYVKEFIRVHDGSTTSLADEEENDLTRVIKKLGTATATIAVSQEGDCGIRGCRAYGLTYISTDNHRGKAEINLAILLENEAMARNALEGYNTADEAMQQFALTIGPGIHPGLPSIDSVQIGEIRRDGSFLLARGTVDIK